MAEIDKASFNAGYLIAVANIMNMHGEDVIARDVLMALGTSESTMRRLGLSEYDTKPLGRLFRDIRRSNAA